MHGTMVSEARNGASVALPLGDERMEQVRELLFGDYKRHCDQQIAALKDRLDELQAGFDRRLQDLEARLATLAADTRNAQKAAFADLARDVGELGGRIRAMAQG
jgi:hypothetical protein